MFTLQDTPLNTAQLAADLADERAGALVAFEGRVRNENEGRRVHSLWYEAYPNLAISEGTRIVEEAVTQFGLIRAACVHRVGHLGLGDVAVWVGALAGHREAAFAACRYIIDNVKKRVPIWKKEFYADGDSGWINAEDGSATVRVPNESPAAGGLSRTVYYSRQARLPEVGEAGQARLGETRVLVVGLGGLGCAAAAYLAGAGIGTLGLVEDDRVELSNLHRQPLYTIEHVGMAKVEAAAARLHRQNPFITVIPERVRLTAENSEALARGYDIILDCTDNLETKFLLNDVAVVLRKKMIHAAVYQYEGHLFGYVPQENVGCLRCLWHTLPEPGCVGACADVGVLGAFVGVLGTMQAAEALKQALELPGALQGEVVIHDFLRHTAKRLRVPRRVNCPTCGGEYLPSTRYYDFTEIEVTAQSLTQSSEVALVLLEDTDKSLRSTAVLPRGFTWVPWEHVKGAFPKDKRLVLCCEYGLRSKYLAYALRQQGFAHVYSLKGGWRSLSAR